MNQLQKLKNKLNEKLLDKGFSKNELQFLGVWDLKEDAKYLQRLIYKLKHFNKFGHKLLEHLDYIQCVSAIQRY